MIPDIVRSDEEESRDPSLESSEEEDSEKDEVSLSGVKIPRPEVIRTSDETSSNSSIGSLGRHVGTLRRSKSIRFLPPSPLFSECDTYNQRYCISCTEKIYFQKTKFK